MGNSYTGGGAPFQDGALAGDLLEVHGQTCKIEHQANKWVSLSTRDIVGQLAELDDYTLYHSA
eukprot:4219070-Pyramimonas_sp.AAC.1